MRHIITAAAAIAVCGFLASTPVRAEPVFQSGGPVKVGDYCKTVTDPFEFYGYYAQCPNEPMHYAKRTKKMKS
jgi:hypothetical protein